MSGCMADRTCRVRPYREGDEAGLVELFNVAFGADVPGFEPRTLEQWRWLYADAPAGSRVIVGETAAGQIIAHYGAILGRFQVSDAVDRSAQMIDSMVHPDWRRGLQREGPFLKTARRFFELYSNAEANALHYGFPNRRVDRIGRRLLRYTPFIEPVPVVFRNLHQDADDDAVGRDFQGALDAVEIDSFGPEMDDLWRRLRPAYRFAVARDATHLQWRFDRCPWLPHRRFLLREPASGRLRGYFVTRSRWQRLPILALTDFLAAPDDAASVAVALRTATHLARATDHVRVECWLPERHPTFRHALAAGFRTEPGLYVMCMNLFVESPTREEALQQCYYTIADSDVW